MTSVAWSIQRFLDVISKAVIKTLATWPIAVSWWKLRELSGGLRWQRGR
jgi:hypothetical protein